MDFEFRNALIGNRVEMIQCLNVDAIMPYLRQDRIISEDTEEEIKSRSTRQSRTAFFLDILPRRGPKVKQSFLNALRSTGQSFIADKLEGKSSVVQEPTQESQQTSSQPSMVFHDLISEVSQMKPAEKINERHGKIYLTSTSTYTRSRPVSKLGEREIPFLFCVKAFGYPNDTVLGWPLAPSKQEFQKSLEIYEKEVSELVNLIKSIDNGGFHITFYSRDERMRQLLYNNQGFKPYIFNHDGYIHIIQNVININTMTPMEINILACLIHLICFTEYRFVFRKSDPPKPNCYLLFKAKGLQRSSVIMNSDFAVVDEALSLDESVSAPSVTTHACPW